eukprot:1178935-Amphidinium_carterae.1
MEMLQAAWETACRPSTLALAREWWPFTLAAITRARCSTMALRSVAAPIRAGSWAMQTAHLVISQVTWG